ncbi:hypothetical protein H1R16_09290 [Marnyiella aurantia]|uniref:DUF4890 domain-containing protein n=1 Tax=Marnyiella aurantia TaxID=2758037 RepID=A0A7D7QTA2_9FLAO|nr:hypothetical protein [Marnyiella aurantia]MBA5246744.1 hypothetical protein [Marnyiella aurantia]QMS97907.1 hypothetical protein H1R16_09290 [Marnyiella aurantia]
MKKIVIATFLSLGTFAMAQQTPAMPESKAQMEQKRADMQKIRAQKQQQHLAEMQKNLNLNVEQMEKIRAMQERSFAEHQNQMQKSREVQKDRMQAMKLKQQQKEAEMKAILTPEQFAKWQESRQKMMAERKAKMQTADGMKMKRNGMHRKMDLQKKP